MVLGSVAPKRCELRDGLWLQASIFVRQSVARIVSPEGRLCTFAAEVIVVGAEGTVPGGVPM